MDEYGETASALGTCHHTVLYSSAELVPMHVPASFGDLHGDAECLPLVECCEWQKTDQSSWSLKGTPSQWPLAGGGPPVEYFAPPEGKGCAEQISAGICTVSQSGHKSQHIGGCCSSTTLVLSAPAHHSQVFYCDS